MSADTALLPRTPDWMGQAACATEDPELWFPHRADEYQRAVAAKEICDGCPVRQPCLAYALDLGIPDGIFGGLTPGGRERLVARSST